MPISPYVAAIRDRIGTSRLLLPSVTAIVYGDDGEILLVRQRDGNIWSTPGELLNPTKIRRPQSFGRLGKKRAFW